MVTVTVANPTRKRCLKQSNTSMALCISVKQMAFAQKGWHSATGCRILGCNVHGQGRLDPQWIWLLGFIQEPTRLELLRYLILSHTYLLPPTITFSRSWLLFLGRRLLLAQECWAQICVCSCCATPRSYQHWCYWLRHQDMDLRMSHCISPSLGSSPTSMIFPPASIFSTFGPLSSFGDHVFFSGTLSTQAPGFPSLSSLCAEAQCLFSLLTGASDSSLLIGGSRMCHFSLVQALSKFTTKQYPLHLAGSRLLLGSGKVLIQILTCRQMYT